MALYAQHLLRRGRPAAALPHLEQFAARESDSPEACYWLGQGLLALGRARPAREAFAAGLRAAGPRTDPHLIQQLRHAERRR